MYHKSLARFFSSRASLLLTLPGDFNNSPQKWMDPGAEFVAIARHFSESCFLNEMTLKIVADDDEKCTDRG